MKRPRRPRRSVPLGTERPCRMPNCRRTTLRPLGYCDTCWNDAKRADERADETES